MNTDTHMFKFVVRIVCFFSDGWDKSLEKKRSIHRMRLDQYVKNTCEYICLVHNSLCTDRYLLMRIYPH